MWFVICSSHSFDVNWNWKSVVVCFIVKFGLLIVFTFWLFFYSLLFIFFILHIAEVPNSGKILLYWLLRSKIWYFRVIWLFIAKFFYKNGIFLCFLEGRGKKSKQNNTAVFSPNSLLRYGAISTFSNLNTNLKTNSYSILEVKFWQ